MLSYHVKRALDKDADKIKEISNKLVLALDREDYKEIERLCRKLRLINSDINATLFTISLINGKDDL